MFLPSQQLDQVVSCSDNVIPPIATVCLSQKPCMFFRRLFFLKQSKRKSKQMHLFPYAGFFFIGCTQWTDIPGENIGWVYKISACLVPALQTWHHCAESIRRCYHHSCCSCCGPSHKRSGPGEKQCGWYSVMSPLRSSQYCP